MLIRHLKYFVTLAEERNFRRAAGRCGISQPTLSQALRRLEDDLNHVLVDRSPRSFALTPEGDKVLLWGRRILAGYDHLHEELKRGGDGLSGRSSALTGVIASEEARKGR